MKKLKEILDAKNTTEIMLRLFGTYSFIIAIGYLFDMVVIHKLYIVWMLVFIGYMGLFGEYDRKEC